MLILSPGDILKFSPLSTYLGTTFPCWLSSQEPMSEATPAVFLKNGDMIMIIDSGGYIISALYNCANLIYFKFEQFNYFSIYFAKFVL